MVSATPIGVADSSVLIALESGRTMDAGSLPDALVATVVTQAELELGVLAAKTLETRARRLTTLDRLAQMRILAATNAAAHEWARLRFHLSERRRRMDVNDLWIAAIAVANELPIVTQDADFDALEGAPGVSVIRV